LSTGFSRPVAGRKPPEGGTQSESGGTQHDKGGSAALSTGFSRLAGRKPPEGGTHSEGDADHTLKPLLVKIAPDLSEAEIESIVDLCLRNRVAGIIATNTTISREGLKTPDVASIGAGGLSGVPLRQRATEVISTIYRHSQGKLPIIGVGGIFTPEDAFEKISAGASLLQAYTGFVYGGPSFAIDISRGLAGILKDRGFANIDEAVGSANRG
jgi:dihydroorotate dehydrogenase